MPTTAATPSRIVGVFPHPDDEAYAAGGTLALAADAGAQVTLVFASGGEKGARFRSDLGPGAALTEVRKRETEDSCHVLGVRAPRWLGLADGAIGDGDTEASTRTLLAVLQELAPDVVVTLGRDGVYGHRDHVACTQLTDRAVAMIAERERPRCLHAAFPRGLFLPVWQSLKQRRGDHYVANVAADDIGIERRCADIIVNIRSVRKRKIAALSSHRSQLPDDDGTKLLHAGIMPALLDEEWFTLASGPPLPEGACDILAGFPRAARNRA